jgi:acetyl esterase/lipase
MILQKRQSAMDDNFSAMVLRPLPRVLALAAIVAAPAASSIRAAAVDVRSNLTYYSGEDADKYRHRLDLYLPKGQRDVPVLMFVHGGGFTQGIKDQYAFVGEVFAARGIATAVINYRLSPKVSHPGHVQDVARAFAWLRAHVAEYGGRPDRIFVSGHSAGGHLAALLGADPKYLQEVGESIDHLAGIIPLSGTYTVSARSGLFTGVAPSANELRDASPIAHAAGPHPPFLLLYGDKDAPRTREDAEQMAAALKMAGTPAEVHELADHAHMDVISGVRSPADEGLRLILAFVNKRQS